MERARLSTARIEKGWSQGDVAERVDVELSTVQRWESGKTYPQPHHLMRLCKLFGKTAEAPGFEKEPTADRAQNTPAEEDKTGDAYQAFCTSKLTMRLFRIVWNCPVVDARYQGLPMAIHLELEDNRMKFDDPQSRRDALRCLASMAIEYCGLSALQPVYKRPIDDILSQCAAGMAACWHLRRGKDLAFASDTVAKYLPTLRDIVKTAPSERQRQAAADLAAQGFILASSFANQLNGNSPLALNYAQQAERYSEKAGNPALQIVALRAQSNAYDFANNLQQALITAQKARHLLEQKKDLPPLLASHVYAALADYQGITGEKQEVLTSLKKAYTSFFAQSPEEPAPLWIPHSQAGLILHDGLAHYHLGFYKEAADSFSQIGELEQVSETTRIEALITQVLAEVQREDGRRDMDLCIALWKKGMQQSVAMRSDQWFKLSVTTLTALNAAWPAERRVKDLRQHIVHW